MGPSNILHRSHILTIGHLVKIPVRTSSHSSIVTQQIIDQQWPHIITPSFPERSAKDHQLPYAVAPSDSGKEDIGHTNLQFTLLLLDRLITHSFGILDSFACSLPLLLIYPYPFQEQNIIYVYLFVRVSQLL